MKIKNYEGALKVLNKVHEAWVDSAPRHIKAQYKLETICEALNIGHKKNRIYFPFWWDKKSLLGGGASDGLGCVSAYGVPSGANANVGSRLCSFDIETALYFGSEPFIKLWQEYLL